LWGSFSLYLHLTLGAPLLYSLDAPSKIIHHKWTTWIPTATKLLRNDNPSDARTSALDNIAAYTLLCITCKTDKKKKPHPATFYSSSLHPGYVFRICTSLCMMKAMDTGDLTIGNSLLSTESSTPPRAMLSPADLLLWRRSGCYILHIIEDSITLHQLHEEHERRLVMEITRLAISSLLPSDIISCHLTLSQQGDMIHAAADNTVNGTSYRLLPPIVRDISRAVHSISSDGLSPVIEHNLMWSAWADDSKLLKELESAATPHHHHIGHREGEEAFRIHTLLRSTYGHSDILELFTASWYEQATPRSFLPIFLQSTSRILVLQLQGSHSINITPPLTQFPDLWALFTLLTCSSGEDICVDTIYGIGPVCDDQDPLYTHCSIARYKDMLTHLNSSMAWHTDFNLKQIAHGRKILSSALT